MGILGNLIVCMFGGIFAFRGLSHSVASQGVVNV